MQYWNDYAYGLVLRIDFFVEIYLNRGKVLRKLFFLDYSILFLNISKKGLILASYWGEIQLFSISIKFPVQYLIIRFHWKCKFAKFIGFFRIIWRNAPTNQSSSSSSTYRSWPRILKVSPTHWSKAPNLSDLRLSLYQGEHPLFAPITASVLWPYLLENVTKVSSTCEGC